MENENKDKALPTAEEMIHEFCGPYGGFVNVITKCGGSLVMMVMSEAMKKYKSIHTADLEARLKEKEEEIFDLKNKHAMTCGGFELLQIENERLKKAAEGLVEALKEIDEQIPDKPILPLVSAIQGTVKSAITNYTNSKNK